MRGVGAVIEMGCADMLLLDDDDELLPEPDNAEAMLSSRLGASGLRAIQDTLTRHTERRWLKVARVVADAITAGGFPLSDEAHVCLHVRRLIGLVDSGALEAQGDLRKPRSSEVRLPGRP